MKTYYDISSCEKIKTPIVTIGTFDGVHIGHQKIINTLHYVAKQNDGETVLITFDPPPKKIIYPDKEYLFLNTIQEKIEKIRFLNIQNLIIQPFTKKFSQIKSVDFIKEYILKYIKPHTIIVGYDHQFGKDKSGSFNLFKKYAKEYNFSVMQIDEFKVKENTISSTQIRHALLNGNIAKANDFLGYYYSIKGNVIKGNQLGRKIGFPTANLKVEENNKLIPQNGVYAVTVDYDGITYNGMLNIGIKPTIGDFLKTIEIHIFDFNKSIYEKVINVFFHKKIRNEKKFKNINQLIQTLKIDQKSCEEYFNNSKI